jgi:hypothetical protein
MAAPDGTYPLLAVYSGATSATNVKGSTYYRVKLSTEVSDIRAVAFQPRGDEPDITRKLGYVKQGTLVAVQLTKGHYYKNGWRTSWQLTGINPLGG